jgi:hypothetical protein
MGGGASILSVTLAENPQLFDVYRKEFAELFTEEYYRLRTLGCSEEEIKQQFLSSLQQNESEIFQRIAAIENQSKSVKKGDPSPSASATSASIDKNEICSRVVESIMTKGAHTFLCCLDGSSNSDLAYELCLSLMKKYDSLCLFHAYCETNFSHLPSSALPSVIRKRYEEKLLASSALIKPSHYSFHFEECYSRSVLRVLTDLIDHHTNDDKRFILPPSSKAPDFVVLGYTGHGQVNAGATDDDSGDGGEESVINPPLVVAPMSLGRTVDAALRSIHLPCIIAKRLCVSPDATSTPPSTSAPLVEGISAPRVFVLAVNSSEQSKRGLDILLRLVSARDVLELLFIQKPDVDPEKIHQLQCYYEDELRRYGPPESRFLKLAIGHQQSVAETIIDYVNHGYAAHRVPDFFAISPRDTVGPARSKLTEQLIHGINTSIVLCKS